MIEHYLANKDEFDLWIRTNEKLQISNDIFKPFIEPFLEANKGVNLQGCQECIIDMLRWVKSEVKKQTKSK